MDEKSEAKKILQTIKNMWASQSPFIHMGYEGWKKGKSFIMYKDLARSSGVKNLLLGQICRKKLGLLTIRFSTGYAIILDGLNLPILSDFLQR